MLENVTSAMHVTASLRMRARCRLPTIVAAARGPGFRTQVLNESKTLTELCVGGVLRSLTRTGVRSGHVKEITAIRPFMLVEPLVGDT